jgi:hypothetical protein
MVAHTSSAKVLRALGLNFNQAAGVARREMQNSVRDVTQLHSWFNYFPALCTVNINGNV